MDDQRGALALLAGAALVAIVLVIVFAQGGDGGDGGGGADEAGITAACGLTAAAASAAVAAITKGHSAQQIAGTTIAGVVVPFACKPVLESLTAQPEEPVTLQLQLPSGEVAPRTVVGQELLTPPPPPSASDIPPGTTTAQLINCGGWDSRILWEMCLAGQLPAMRTSYASQLPSP